MNVPANILFIASRGDIAGGEVYLLSLLRELDRTRFHPTVVLPWDGPFRPALEQLGVETVLAPVNYGWLQPPQEWYPFLDGLQDRVKGLARLMRVRGVRIVHTHSNMILEGALAARLAGVPHLHHAHAEFSGELPIYQRFPLGADSFARFVGAHSERVIAVSRPVAARLSPPVPADKVRVIFNGIDPAPYETARAARQNRLRSEIGIPEGGTLVMAIGRLHPEKGFETLLEAAGKVALSHPGTWFALAGTTDAQAYADGLKRRAQELGLQERFLFLGHRHDIAQWLAESDVFVLTSRAEGGPFVLMEALAASCPAIASRCGGIVEDVIEHEISGLLFEYGDVDSLAAHLDTLLSDPGRRATMGRSGHERLLAGGFDLATSARKLMQLYEEVLASPPPAAGDYGVEVFLQVCGELGYLGGRVIQLEERLKHLEQSALRRPALGRFRNLKKFIPRP